jgi:hypothetical protein
MIGEFFLTSATFWIANIWVAIVWEEITHVEIIQIVIVPWVTTLQWVAVVRVAIVLTPSCLRMLVESAV